MTRSRRWESTLSELGQFLDNQNATTLRVVEEPRCLAVSWQAGRDTSRQCCFLEVYPRTHAAA
jgi:hypothetical protein